MKKLVSALLSTAAVGLLTFGTFASASAGELRLWEHDNYNGFYTTYGSCDVDFPDNIYDSGKQNLVDYVTIWNNTVFAGDKAIAKIKKDVGKPTFDAKNAADHATCFG
ncbi:hypothetical protein AALA26_08250 [Bifidobacterium pseudolongum]|uniref:Uncharacterized protein n=1 Tax=Bifidobacterium pseudolongum TaxID=1694 RepID=A0AB37NUU2_9BIFI|nr:hypothetical protein [Bifidobacterium pseudolongum]NBH69940.1 hypothetical protein [Bifidobacterium pseudolongum]RKI87107.1 hypothetical protein D7V89_08460 [Bifidobacterium pseudolongum]RYQ35081.1 hypothetical protein PG2009B_0258 [Bifidobacterium pseudolongum subsp. globosum]